MNGYNSYDDNSFESLSNLISNLDLRDTENTENFACTPEKNNTENSNLNILNPTIPNESQTSKMTSNSNNSNNNSIPLTLNIDPLKYLGKIPEFSGDYRDLQNFVNLIDKVHPLLLQYDATSQSIFSDVIKSRLKGKARECVEINNHVTCWLEIKQILINNFGDRCSLEELFDQLRGTTFKTNCANFYNEIKTILRRLNVKTRLNAGDDLANTEQIIENSKSSALTIFKNKIPEPMRSMLYCRNPDTLEDAMDILHEAGYAYYNVIVSNTNNSTNNKHNNPNHSRNNNNKINPNIRNNRGNFTFQTNRQQNNRQQYNKPQNYRNDRFRDNRTPRPISPNTQNPFSRNNFTLQDRSQGNHNHSNNNFGNWQNNFQQNNQLPPPEPMDINLNQSVQPVQPQNFQSPASIVNYPI